MHETATEPMNARIKTATDRSSRRYRKAIGDDGRTPLAYRNRQLVRRLVQALGHAPSPVELALVEQCGGLMLRGEQLRAKLRIGERISDEELVRSARAVSHLLGKLGLVSVDLEPEPPSDSVPFDMSPIFGPHGPNNSAASPAHSPEATSAAQTKANAGGDK